MKFQADKKHVSVTGRTIYREGIRYLGYSATSISFKFVGTKATAEIVSDASKHTEKEWAWIAIYYGQDRDPAKRLRLEQDRQTIVLFETQQTTEQQITIVKYSEAEYAACGIVSIEITDEVNPGEEILLSPPVHKKRQIEFFGDSITCGYGVEGDVSDEILIPQMKIRPNRIHCLPQNCLMQNLTWYRGTEKVLSRHIQGKKRMHRLMIPG